MLQTCKKMAKIVFLSPEHQFSGIDLREKALGGIPSVTIMLAESMAKLGHQITVQNAVKDLITYNNVNYQPFDKTAKIIGDLVISNNSARPLRNVEAKKKVVWQHNRTSLSRVYKRKEIWELCFTRPNLVCLSDNAKKNTLRLLPYRSSTVIQHGIEDVFFNPTPASSAPDKPKALFASRPYRGLDWLLKTWESYILPAIPDAELHICTPKLSDQYFGAKGLKAINAIHHGPLPKTEVAKLMRECRLLLYPGHQDETGCCVALESMASGLPIITLGYGCLKNQVQHDTTGYIEKNASAFASRAIKCFQDDSLWLKLHRNTLKSEWIKNWDSIACKWEQAFLRDI